MSSVCIQEWYWTGAFAFTLTVSLGLAIDLDVIRSFKYRLTNSRASWHPFFPRIPSLLYSHQCAMWYPLLLQNLVSGQGAPLGIADTEFSLRSWPFIILRSSSTTRRSDAFQFKRSSRIVGTFDLPSPRHILLPTIGDRQITEVEFRE